jgi:hypothetical protein
MKCSKKKFFLASPQSPTLVILSISKYYYNNVRGGCVAARRFLNEFFAGPIFCVKSY